MSEFIQSLELPYQEQSKNLGDYLSLLKRYKKSIFLTFLVAFLVFLLAAFLWPPTYQSSATILIEEQDIPVDFVRSTITSFAAQRIQVINTRVMTRANLMRLIDKHGLYSRLRERETTDELVQRMREDTKLETLSADVIDPRSGRPMTATIAFTLSFDGRQPETVLKVTNELASLYLNENLKTRTEKATQTSEFLADEAQRLSVEISELESKLAEFKKEHGESLPEFKQLNFQLMERVDQEISTIENQLRALEDRKFYLEGQLAQINPGSPIFSSSGERILGPEDRLKAIKTEYLRASNLYRENHPDLVKMRREIAALEDSTGKIGMRTDHAKELTHLRAELAQKQDRYKSSHPEISKIKKRIEQLEKTLANHQQAVSARSIMEKEPENPAYITLKAQLDSVVSEISAFRHSLSRQQEKRAGLEQRLVQAPQVERDYLNISRDYENAVLKYREIKAKLTEANIAKELERERKGERFSLIDPPALPEEPVSPNRLLIMIFGLLVSTGLGFGQAFLRDTMDGSIHSPDEITLTTGEAPLTVIPLNKTLNEIKKQKRIRLISVFSIAALILIGLTLIHFFYSPLDVLWFRIERQLGHVLIF